MKILYVGSERSDAQAIATALRGLDHVVTVSWISHLEHAAKWLDENRDLAALVIDTKLDGKSPPSVLPNLRELAWHPAAVVIVPSEAGPLEPDPAVLYVHRNPSFLRELPVVVTRAIERAGRRALEQQLERATAALHDAEQRHRAAVAAADRHLAELQSQYEIGMARAAATWDMVDEQLRTAALEVERARQDQASAAADVDRLSQRLAASDAAVEAANGRAEHQRLMSAEQLAERERELQAEIAREVDRRRNVEDLLAEAACALDDAEMRHASETRDRAAYARELEETLRVARLELEAKVADLEQLEARATELDSRLTDTIDSRADLERRLAATEAAFDQAVTRATRDRLDASRKAAAREAELDGDLQRERAARAAIEQTAANGETARRDAQAARDDLARQLADATGALEEAARQRAELDAQIQQERGTCDALEQAIEDAELAFEQVRRDLQSAANEIENLAERENDLRSQLAERQARFDRELTRTAADCDRLAQKLTETDAILEQSRHDHQAAAADVERLTAHAAELTSQLTDARAALLDERQQHEAALAAADATLSLRQAGFEHLLSERAADRDRLIRQLGDMSADLDDVCRAYEFSNIDIERLTKREAELTSQLADTEAALVDAQQRHDAALAAAATQFAEHQARLDRELLAATDECDRLSEQLSDAGASLEQARQDHDATVAEVEHLTQQEAELRSELATVQTERNILGQSLADARARALELEEEFNDGLARERLEHESQLRDAQARSQQLQEALASSVEALEASRAESHRLFEQSELAMFRCTPDGTLIDANRACTTLVGRQTADDLREARFPAAVFDAPNALFWLIERCLSTRMKETVEATWRRQDGGRLFVRLSARASRADVIECIAEDLTRVRILEERLSQAHRMEAVGRLASEIAVTCGNLLNDIHHSGREWLMTDAAAASRQSGERLLDDIKRAASLMQELAACGGEQQARTPMLVDLNTLIRDLEPVLKRVAGGDVEVQLQDNASPLNVDVGTERVERLLVNLASYGRERMPSGGQLRIELGKSVVDRRFAAKHPNVRLGLHALITVTEIRRAGETDAASPPRARKPGVDFGTLQGLVSECGGHLWMKIQPPGEMVAKIRLPLSIPREQTPPRIRMAKVGRERLPARWFQS